MVHQAAALLFRLLVLHELLLIVLSVPSSKGLHQQTVVRLIREVYCSNYRMQENLDLNLTAQVPDYKQFGYFGPELRIVTYNTIMFSSLHIYIYNTI